MVVRDSVYGMFTKNRCVDLLYIALIAKLAAPGEMVSVDAAEFGWASPLHFQGRGWDAFLMPARIAAADATVAMLSVASFAEMGL